MAITTFNHQLPTTLLALEEPKPSRFSQVDSSKGWDNPFKKIALAVAHIFTALRDWISKPFSKNITIAKSEKTTEVTSTEIKPEPLIKSEPVTKTANTALLSSEEIASVKAQFFTLKQCEYAKKYEEKTGKMPTEDHLLKVFNDKKLKQLNKKIDRLLEKLTPEYVEKLRARRNQTPTPSENTSDQKQASTAFYSTVLNESKKVVSHLITPSGVAGFGVGLVSGLTTNLVSNLGNRFVAQPILGYVQEVGGPSVTQGLQFSAIWNRMRNWSTQWADTSKTAIAATTTVGYIIGHAPLAGPLDLTNAFQGVKDYMENPQTAISCESGYFIRKIVNQKSYEKVLQLGQGYLSNESHSGSFKYGYNAGFITTLLLGQTILGYLGLKPF